jgi:hypothetical protein
MIDDNVIAEAWKRHQGPPNDDGADIPQAPPAYSSGYRDGWTAGLVWLLGNIGAADAYKRPMPDELSDRIAALSRDDATAVIEWAGDEAKSAFGDLIHDALLPVDEYSPLM